MKGGKKGGMLYVYSSNIHTGKFEEFERWVVGQQDSFSKAQPSSWNLKGVYFQVFGLGQAHVEIHWEIESYAALDEARKMAQSKGEYFKMLTEMHSFLDPATGKGRILADVASRDAIIVGC